MRLALVGKYPPIQGGVSRSTFWMAHALAENDIDVHVVTNSQEVEPEFRTFDLGAWEPALKLAPQPRPRFGSLAVHTTELDAGASYIPWARPFVTKLAGLTAAVVEDKSCSLIHGSYWEPYGMAAHLASTWTGVPFGLQHAGSDVGRLYLDAQLKGAYRRMLKAADYQILSPQTCDLSQELGLDPNRMYPLAATLPPMDYFSPETSRLSIPLALRGVRDYFSKHSPLGPEYAGFAEHEFSTDAPTVGVFGKIGRGKSLVELIAALGQLHERGVKFNFVLMGQGRRTDVSDAISWLEAFGIRERTFLLPFLPHWQVPHFIRACDLVCNLEKGFPITFHTPVIAMEVVACGTCLLMSDEIAAKQLFRSKVRNGRNAFVVDPTDKAKLADILRKILSEPEKAAVVGERGEQELALRDPSAAYGTKISTRFLQIARDVSERRVIDQLSSDISTFERSAEAANLEPEVAAKSLQSLEVSYRKARLPRLLDEICGELKMTQRLMHGELRSQFEEFYLGPKIPHDCDTRATLLAFSDHVHGVIQNAGDVPPYTSDVLRFEVQRFKMKGEPHAPSRTEQPLLDRQRSRPVKAKGLSVLESEFDVPRLLERLRNLRPDDPLPSPGSFNLGSSCIVVKRVHQNEIEPESLSISQGSQVILAACDGKRSVEGVVSAVLEAYPAENGSSVRQGLEKLWKSRCLEDAANKQRLTDLPVAAKHINTQDSQYIPRHSWQSLGLCANAYPKRVVQTLIGRNVDRAHFNLCEEAGSFILRFKPLHDDYGEGEILDELNYLCFAEKQREIAEPIRREIVEGLVRKFGGKGETGQKSKDVSPDGTA